MPSPIVHGATGCAIYMVYRRFQPAQSSKQVGSLPFVLLVMISLSLLPDLDFVLGIVAGDFGRFHNIWTHSLIFGLVVAFVVGAVVWSKKHRYYMRWFILALLCYELHLVMDFFTIGDGILAFWPLSAERYFSPLAFFYGLHWSDGVLSIRHLWTFVTEIAFVIPLLLGIRYLLSRKCP